MTAITIDNTGRLEIPLEIRQQLGLTSEQSLNLEVRVLVPPDGINGLNPLTNKAYSHF